MCAKRLFVSRTSRGSLRRGASGEASGTGESPSCQPMVPDEKTSAPDGAV